MTNYLPPLGFSFKVEIEGFLKNSNDVQLKSISGLNVDIELEESPELSEN